MPRVVNLGLAVFFVAVLAPITTNLDGKPGYVQVALVLIALPFLLVAVLCLLSAARPGSLARAARRARARRKG